MGFNPDIIFIEIIMLFPLTNTSDDWENEFSIIGNYLEDLHNERF